MSTCSSWTSRSCSTGSTTSTRSIVRSARNGSTCSAPSTRRIFVASHQHEAAARQKNLVNTLARKSEVHNNNVHMQVRQLEHEGDARFSERQRRLLSRFSLDANQALEDQRDMLVTEVTLEVWRRDDKCATYVRVFKHYSRKTLRSNKIKNMLNYVST